MKVHVRVAPMPSVSPARILFCESNTDGTVGGSHFCLLHLIQGLDRRRFTPIAVFYEEHSLFARFSAACDTRVIAPLRPRPSTTRGAAAALLRRIVNAGKFVQRVGFCIGFLKRERIDLLHLNNSITRHHDWMFAAVITRTPMLTHERGINPRYSATSRWMAARLGAVVAVSHWVANHMRAQGVPAARLVVHSDGLEPDAVVVRSSADAIRREWNIPAAAPVIGIVGNVREWKGQEVVARALAQVVRAVPEVVCLFVGAVTPEDRPYEARVRQVLAEGGVSGHARFTGYRSNVADFVNTMQVLVHASVIPEPVGMVALEGMALRKPVVATASGGVAEIVTSDTGMTYPAGDAAALAERIVALLGAPELAETMGNAGYRRLTTVFRQDHYVAAIVRIYEALLSRVSGEQR